GFAVTCPLHGTAFDVRDGSHSGPPAWEGVPCHEVSESGSVAVVVLSSGERDNSGPDAGRLQTR
ncbi:MAG: nitrite reductase/ring-hydroxylating ferredoxin subunit, partial [Candidatus Aldehydirespiratoraceae bacterium]